jgi:metal-responsive CopG/Arc/MetJ family transcriptional regulator
MKQKEYKLATSDGKVKLSINLDGSLLEEIDIDCKSKGLRRSDWLSIAAMRYLKKDDIDKKTRTEKQ